MTGAGAIRAQTSPLHEASRIRALCDAVVTPEPAQMEIFLLEP